MCLLKIGACTVQCGQCCVKRKLHASAKGIDPSQPAQSAQADMARNLLPLVNFIHVKRVVKFVEGLIHKLHYLPLDGMVNIHIYLVWASWVRNGTTLLNDNRYFEIQT